MTIKTGTAKHTPGPWEVWDAVEGNIAKLHVGIKTPSGSVRLASLPDRRASAIGEDHANARLIAAAPELLEALEQCVKYLNDIKPLGLGNEGAQAYDARISAYDAIRKAKGEL